MPINVLLSLYRREEILCLVNPHLNKETKDSALL